MLEGQGIQPLKRWKMEKQKCYADFMREHPEMHRACSCGAREGKSSHPVSEWAHPESCEERKSCDEMMAAWSKEIGGTYFIPRA